METLLLGLDQAPYAQGIENILAQQIAFDGCWVPSQACLRSISVHLHFAVDG